VFASYLNSVRGLSRDVRLYLVTAFVVGFTVFGGMYTVLNNLYVLRLGYDTAFIGLMSAGNLLIMGVVGLPAGAAGRRWGSRRAMITGLLLTMAGYILFGLSELIPPPFQGPWLLAVFTFTGGVLTLYIVNSAPLVMVIADETRDFVFSFQTALFALAAFFGGLAGGVMPGLFASLLGVTIDAPAPYRYAVLSGVVLFIPAILALIAIGPVDDRPPPPTGEGRVPLPIGLIALLAFISLLQVAGEGPARVFFNVYLDTELGMLPAQIGLLMGLGMLLSAPAALVTQAIMARWGVRRTYVRATLGVSLSLLPLALIPMWQTAGLGYMAILSFAAISRAPIVIFQMESVPPEWRSYMSGAASMATGLSWGLMAVGGGYAVDAVGYRGLFLAGALITACGALLFWSIFVRNQPARAIAR